MYLLFQQILPGYNAILELIIIHHHILLDNQSMRLVGETLVSFLAMQEDLGSRIDVAFGYSNAVLDL